MGNCIYSGTKPDQCGMSQIGKRLCLVMNPGLFWGQMICVYGCGGARQDNARPHEARVAQNFLRHFQSLPSPARTQDLSPVEHVWDQLKRQMPSCHSVHDLELTVKDWWALLPQNNIRCLINSMPDRGVACIAAGDRRQEEEPMDWEDVPFLPEVSAPFVPSRPPRKMRSLISVQVSEPPSLSANRFPNMRALVPKKLLGAVDTRRYPHAENRVWSDQEDHEERGYRRIVRQALVEATVTRSTIRADVGVAIVPQTISRHLAEGNLKSKRPFRALLLTPEHWQLHLHWYQARSMWNVTDWQKVVFSDESRFVLGTDDKCVRVWRRPYRRQEEEPMDWEDVPFLPEVSAPFVPSRPPRKMRSLISVQVSEPPSFSQPLPQHEGSRSEEDRRRFESSLDVTNAFRSTNNVYIITGYSIDEDFGKPDMRGKRARRHFSQLSEFESDLIIGMKSAGWSTRRVAEQLDRSECAVRNCWEQGIREGTHARKKGSGATRNTTRREERRIVRQALVDPTVTRSTIRADVGVAIVPQTISRHLAESNLKSKRPFRALPLTPEHGQLMPHISEARINVPGWL
ncbi:transposable element Tc1 transposase [Trichonephila clavipes]|nr:transposable element Tc1 transposase [Trichonephila clavipes]